MDEISSTVRVHAAADDYNWLRQSDRPWKTLAPRRAHFHLCRFPPVIRTVGDLTSIKQLQQGTDRDLVLKNVSEKINKLAKTKKEEKKY